MDASPPERHGVRFDYDEFDWSCALVWRRVAPLWGDHGFVGRTYAVLDVWRDCAADVNGRALPSDHYLPEEQPELVAEAVREFFRPTWSPRSGVTGGPRGTGSSLWESRLRSYSRPCR